jgi:hypothetical protein
MLSLILLAWCGLMAICFALNRVEYWNNHEWPFQVFTMVVTVNLEGLMVVTVNLEGLMVVTVNLEGLEPQSGGSGE